MVLQICSSVDMSGQGVKPETKKLTRNEEILIRLKFLPSSMLKKNPVHLWQLQTALHLTQVTSLIATTQLPITNASNQGM